MSRADAKIRTSNPSKWSPYLVRVLATLGWLEDVEFQDQIGGLEDKCLFDILTCPPEISARALAEVIHEMG